MSKFNICQKSEKKCNLHKIGGAHLQYVNNHLAKFEYKGIKTFGVTDYTNLVPLKCCGQPNIEVQHPSKMKKKLNVHKIEGAHLQYVNNHLAKFEYKGIKTFGVTDYTNLVPLKCCGRPNVEVQHPSKMTKNYERCTK